MASPALGLRCASHELDGSAWSTVNHMQSGNAHAAAVHCLIADGKV